MNRRDFIRSTAAGAVAIATGGAVTAGVAIPEPAPRIATKGIFITKSPMSVSVAVYVDGKLIGHSKSERFTISATNSGYSIADHHPAANCLF